MKKGFKFGGLLMASALILGACSGTADDELKIGDKTYSLDEVKDLKGSDYYLADAVLFKILDELYGTDEVKKKVDDTYDTYLGQLDASVVENLTDADKEGLKRDITISLELEKFYTDNVTVTDEEVKEKKAEGYQLAKLYHAIVLDGSDESYKLAKEELAKASTQEDYDKLVEKYAESNQIAIEYSEYTPDGVVEGFEGIFTQDLNAVVEYGDSVYKSVIKVVEREDATDEAVRTALLSAKIYEKYTDATSIIKDIASNEDYKDKVVVGEKVYELFEKDIEDTNKKSAETTSEEITGEEKEKVLEEFEKAGEEEKAKEEQAESESTDKE